MIVAWEAGETSTTATANRAQRGRDPHAPATGPSGRRSGAVSEFDVVMGGDPQRAGAASAVRPLSPRPRPSPPPYSFLPTLSRRAERRRCASSVTDTTACLASSSSVASTQPLAPGTSPMSSKGAHFPFLRSPWVPVPVSWCSKSLLFYYPYRYGPLVRCDVPAPRNPHANSNP